MKDKRKNNIRRKRSQTLSASWLAARPHPRPLLLQCSVASLATESAALPATLRRLLCHPRRLLPTLMGNGLMAVAHSTETE